MSRPQVRATCALVSGSPPLRLALARQLAGFARQLHCQFRARGVNAASGAAGDGYQALRTVLDTAFVTVVAIARELLPALPPDDDDGDQMWPKWARGDEGGGEEAPAEQVGGQRPSRTLVTCGHFLSASQLLRDVQNTNRTFECRDFATSLVNS
eukprot:3775289-Pyramimonas_sp.AAC.1